jgi:hypothetical protein
MTARIGLEVRAHDVRAIIIESGSVAWHGAATLGDSVSVADAVGGLLAAAPKMRGFRPSVVAAVCFTRAQVKRLDGLPSLEVRSQMTQLVRENAGSIFLRTAATTAIPDVHQAGNGVAWAAAFDQSVIDAVVAGAARRAFRVSLVLPTASALARIYPSMSIYIHDGVAQVALRTEQAHLCDVRRTAERGASAAIPASLAKLGDEASAYLGAYAAALSGRREPLAWKPESAPAAAAVARRARLLTAVLSLIIAGAVALAAPGLHAALFVRQARGSSMRAPDPAMETARAEADLRRATQLLETVDQFASSRAQLTRLLAELTESLPESTAIVTLRVDSTEGTFVAISPHVTDLLAELGSIQQIASPRIAGSVTREIVAGARLERAAFRFQRPHGAARSAGTPRVAPSRR